MQTQRGEREREREREIEGGGAGGGGDCNTLLDGKTADFPITSLSFNYHR